MAASALAGQQGTLRPITLLLPSQSSVNGKGHLGGGRARGLAFQVAVTQAGGGPDAFLLPLPM